MKLLLDIDQELFDTVKRLTKARTKKEAIVISMQEYLRNRQKMEATKLMRNYRHGMTLRQLLQSRKQWKRS